MQIDSCNPHLKYILIEHISYEEAVILQNILEREDESVHDRIGPSRWVELIGALQLIIDKNQPEETLAASK